jgi:hypothetical protein
MKKEKTLLPTAYLTLSNGVTAQIQFSDPAYTQKFANELLAMGTLLGSWINGIEVKDKPAD